MGEEPGVDPTLLGLLILGGLAAAMLAALWHWHRAEQEAREAESSARWASRHTPRQPPPKAPATAAPPSPAVPGLAIHHGTTRTTLSVAPDLAVAPRPAGSRAIAARAGRRAVLADLEVPLTLVYGAGTTPGEPRPVTLRSVSVGPHDKLGVIVVLNAWCHARRGPRMFRMERVRSLQDDRTGEVCDTPRAMLRWLADLTLTVPAEHLPFTQPCPSCAEPLMVTLHRFERRETLHCDACGAVLTMEPPAAGMAESLRDIVHAFATSLRRAAGHG